MNLESLVGKWVLTGSISTNSEITFMGEEADPNGIKDWLNGSGRELFENIKPTSGLTLELLPDGTFTEAKTGNPEVYWFSNEGVLESEVIPFNGLIKSNEFGFFLQPDEIPPWAAPTDKYGVILRYDDGDTKICDRLSLSENTLIRTVNVVTDELYLDRIAITYKRS